MPNNTTKQDLQQDNRQMIFIIDKQINLKPFFRDQY